MLTCATRAYYISIVLDIVHVYINNNEFHTGRPQNQWRNTARGNGRTPLIDTCIIDYGRDVNVYVTELRVLVNGHKHMHADRGMMPYSPPHHRQRRRYHIGYTTIRCCYCRQHKANFENRCIFQDVCLHEKCGINCVNVKSQHGQQRHAYTKRLLTILFELETRMYGERMKFFFDRLNNDILQYLH